MSRFVEVPLKGGMGNQLFQVAAGLAISKRIGKQVKFSTNLLEIPQTGGIARRNLAVGELLQLEELITRGGLSNLQSSFNTILRMPSRGITERDISENVLDRLSRTTNLVNGYFQNWEIVEDSWAQLLQRFGDSSRFRILTEAEIENRIGVHIRLGDYKSSLKARQFHGLTHPSYYVEAIKDAAHSLGTSTVMVVSDEPLEAVATLRSNGLNQDFNLQIGNASDEVGDLSLLATSSSIVMSNSSFSWWGAWIGTKRFNSAVYYPQPWFGDHKAKEPNLCYKGWTKLNRNLL